MKTGYIYIADNIYESLFAISELEQQRGLMFEPSPPPIMTFVYSSPRINKFWMKNTPSPLDIIFCYNGKINQIHKGVPYSCESIGKDCISDLVIELPFGTAKQSYININDPVGIIRLS